MSNTIFSCKGDSVCITPNQFWEPLNNGEISEDCKNYFYKYFHAQIIKMMIQNPYVFPIIRK